MREKLFELLMKARENSTTVCDSQDSCWSCPYRSFGANCLEMLWVDYLIEHGVTIQETKEEVE